MAKKDVLDLENHEKIENNSCYAKRRQLVYDWMADEHISVIMLQDNEDKRDMNLRYLCGIPSDAVLVLSSPGNTAVLFAWDVNMAKLYSDIDVILPLVEFEMSSIKALRAALDYFKIPFGSQVEIPSTTSYPNFLKFIENIPDYDILCRQGGFERDIEDFRAVKDDAEIAIYKECCAITNKVISDIVKNVSDGTLKSETDVALFIEKESRKKNCDGTGFGTLAAGADRSFGIHCFPNFTSGAFANKGLSILDFGLVWKGYTSDVTLTFARDITKEQDKLLTMVEKAFSVAYNCVKNGAGADGIIARNVAIEVDNFFAKGKRKMPHGLGHGIGLQAHEAPYLKRSIDNTWILKPNMIFTIEPGLYDPILGGARFENDILLLENKSEILTKSAIVRL